MLQNPKTEISGMVLFSLLSILIIALGEAEPQIQGSIGTKRRVSAARSKMSYGGHKRSLRAESRSVLRRSTSRIKSFHWKQLQ